MSAVGQVLRTVISPVATALGLLGGNAPQRIATPLPQVTPRTNSTVMDALANRRGSAANMRTGSTGAESATGKKSLMGQ